MSEPQVAPATPRGPVSHPRRLLVRLPNWVGDIMMALPALQALRAAHSKAEIVVMVRPDHVDFVRRISGLDGAVAAAPRNGPDRYRSALATTRELRQGDFDAAVVLASSFEAALTVWLAGIKVRVGHDTDHRGALLNRVVPKRKTHQSDLFLDVVKELESEHVGESFTTPVDAEPGSAGGTCRFRCGPEEREWAQRFLARAGMSVEARPIFINPAAAKRPRAWAADRFVQLAEALVERHADTAVIVHDHHPFEVPSDWSGKRRIHVLSGASLMQLAGVVERCCLYVGNNSGPMHIAAALGIPTVGVFGSMSPGVTAPRSPNGAQHVSVTANFECSPCRERFFEECPSPPSVDERPPCLNAIPVESVVRAVDEALRPPV